MLRTDSHYLSATINVFPTTVHSVRSRWVLARPRQTYSRQWHSTGNGNESSRDPLTAPLSHQRYYLRSVVSRLPQDETGVGGGRRGTDRRVVQGKRECLRLHGDSRHFRCTLSLHARRASAVNDIGNFTRANVSLFPPVPPLFSASDNRLSLSQVR